MSLGVTMRDRIASMKGPSEAVSVIDVEPLAVQLAEILKNLYGFWGSVQNAPTEMNIVVNDLEFLGEVLKDIEVDGHGHEHHATTRKILESCKTKMKGLWDTAETFELRFASKAYCTRNWTAVKAVLRERTITKLQRLLEELKLTVIFARQYSSL
jgi:hypothetical protein